MVRAPMCVCGVTLMSFNEMETIFRFKKLEELFLFGDVRKDCN